MNISNIANNPQKCCGCNACEVICPIGAIQMISDPCGHFYPQVDEEKCVNCSLCIKGCCEATPVEQKKPFIVLAASYKNRTISAKSSSGGIFAALAEEVLSRNGIVYGTCFSEYFEAQVISIESMTDLYRLQGSKYVQSKMGSIYKDIESQLQRGRTVLFSGVPCQVAAVKSFLNKDYDNLIAVDVVCHGTPSNKMFLDYLDYVQKKKKIEVVDFFFRDKDLGQDTKGKIVYKQNHYGKIVYKQKSLIAYRSSYYKLFLKCATFRPGCYSCRFAAPERVGDISLCDYWGIEEFHPDFIQTVRDEGLCGISAVMINTDRGKELIQCIDDKIVQIRTEYSSVRKNNPQLNSPSKKNSEHDKVMRLYVQNGYKAVDDFYFKKYRPKIIMSFLWQLLPGKFKKTILLFLR